LSFLHAGTTPLLGPRAGLHPLAKVPIHACRLPPLTFGACWPVILVSYCFPVTSLLTCVVSSPDPVVSVSTVVFLPFTYVAHGPNTRSTVSVYWITRHFLNAPPASSRRDICTRVFPYLFFSFNPSRCIFPIFTVATFLSCHALDLRLVALFSRLFPVAWLRTFPHP